MSNDIQTEKFEQDADKNSDKQNLTLGSME